MGGVEILALIALTAAPLPGDSSAVTASVAARSDTLHRAPGASAPDSLPLRLRPVGNAAESRPGAELVEPSGVACDAFGRLYVSDASLHRLQRFDARGRWLGSSGALGSDAGQLHRPGAVGLLGTLSVAVLDRENRRVVTFDLFGQQQGILIDLGDPALESQLGRVDPVALAADRGGAVYVADQDRDRLLVFDFSGRYLRTLGGFGARPGSFRALAGVATAPRGEIVTAERGGARVQRLEPGGRVAASWPIPVEPGRLALPVAADDSCRVAVADERGGALWVFDRDGRLLASARGLAGPRALAFAPDGTLLVAEAAAGRVRRFLLERAPRPAAASGD